MCDDNKPEHNKCIDNCEIQRKKFYMNNFINYITQDNLYWYMGEHVLDLPLPPGVTFLDSNDPNFFSYFDGINFYPPTIVTYGSLSTIPFFYIIAPCVSQDVINNLTSSGQTVYLNRALRSPNYMPKTEKLHFTTDMVFLSVYFVNKINQLCLNPCIKKKIVDNIIAKAGVITDDLSLNCCDKLVENDSDDNVYYIPNYLSYNSIANPLGYLLYVKQTLKTYYNIKCCCVKNKCTKIGALENNKNNKDNKDNKEDCNLDFDVLCKYMFDKFCVVDVLGTIY